MKRMRTRLILLLTGIVLVASILSVPISVVITKTFVIDDVRHTVLLGFAVKEIITSVLIILICITIIGIVSRKAVSPVVELSKATRQIASGNFDISISGLNRKDEPGQLARDFTLMAQELKANEYLRKDFISNVSHEFRTPLSIISGYAKLIDSDEITNEERHAYSVTIQNESKKLIKLTSDLLSISKLDHQKIQEQSAEFSLDEQIRQTVLLFQPEWSSKNIFIDIDVPKIMYWGNEALIAQVWSNLIENAIKFTGDRGVICVYASVNEERVIVKISDNGEGMSSETQARIFEQFFQGDSSHSSQGHGLGLALVKKILDFSNGSISVSSKPESGSTFIVTLPFNKSE